MLLHLSALYLAFPVGTFAAQSPAQTWRVLDRPLLSIGSQNEEGPQSFGAITGATRLGSGTIVVADGKSLELRLFSQSGVPLKVIGRKGDGPGEFRSMAPIQRCAGDSVLVYDPVEFRISVFSPVGEFVRMGDLREWSANGLPPYEFACGRTGVLAFLHRSDAPPPRAGPMRSEVELSLVVRGGSVVSLGSFPASEQYYRPPGLGPRHLGKKTSIAVGSRSVYVGTADAFEIAEFSLGGERVATIREQRSPVEVRDAQVNAYIQEYLAARPRRASAQAITAAFRQLEWPKHYAAYGRLIVDSEDNLWVEEYPIPGKDVRDWTVYGGGRRLALVRLPARFRLLEVGTDYVLGVWQDDLDVDYLRVYPLRK